MNLFSKDIYKNLRPKKLNFFKGMKLPDFPSIKDVEYKDALIYPRFVFKDEAEKAIFETSDYKKISSILGNTTLQAESIFNYENRQYRILEISIEVLDIVIDYSNGQTEYFIGEPIPFHLEIHIKVKNTNLYEIANEFANKCYNLLEREGELTDGEKIKLIEFRSEAERCYLKLISNIEFPELYFNYGVFKSSCDLNEEAVELIKKALKLEPNNPKINYGLGFEYGNLNDTELEYYYMKKASELYYEPADEYLREYFPNGI